MTSPDANKLRQQLFLAIEPAIYNHNDTHYLDQSLDKLEALFTKALEANNKRILDSLPNKVKTDYQDIEARALGVGYNQALTAVTQIIKEQS